MLIFIIMFNTFQILVLFLFFFLFSHSFLFLFCFCIHNPTQRQKRITLCMLTATAAATAAPPSPPARKKVKATWLAHLDMFQPVGGLDLGQPVSFVNGRKTLLLQLAWAAHAIHNIMSRASLACIHSLRNAGVFLATKQIPSEEHHSQLLQTQKISLRHFCSSNQCSNC